MGSKEELGYHARLPWYSNRGGGGRQPHLLKAGVERSMLPVGMEVDSGFTDASVGFAVGAT